MALSPDRKRIMEKTLPRGRVFFDFADLPDYTHDAAEITAFPDALFFAENEADLVAVMDLGRKLDLPVIIRGAGTGYTGGVVASNGGILVSVERLNAIRIDPDTKTAVVGPGAITGDIMKQAETVGLFYPPDPASYLESTIGGNLAENAGGLRCKKYGVTKDYVIAVRGLDADGRALEIRDTSPFGLLDIMIGSEGTLFVFTEITLRLIPLPRPGQTILAAFDNAVDAGRVVADVTAAGIVPCIMEFMDRGAIACANAYDPEHHLDSAGAMLLFETDGHHADAEADAIRDLCRHYGPTTLRTAEDDTERDTLWATRRNLSNAVKAAYKSKTAEDVCVPPSRLPDLIAFVNNLAGRLTIDVNCYGHAGDGNLHVNFLGTDGTAAEEKQIAEGVTRLFARTLELGGTLTGEHGIGLTKMRYISDEFSPDTLAFMKRLKQSLDPHRRLNPGKIFPGD